MRFVAVLNTLPYRYGFPGVDGLLEPESCGVVDTNYAAAKRALAIGVFLPVPEDTTDPEAAAAVTRAAYLEEHDLNVEPAIPRPSILERIELLEAGAGGGGGSSAGPVTAIEDVEVEEYTLVAADVNKLKRFVGTDDQYLNAPDDATASFPVGSVVWLELSTEFSLSVYGDGDAYVRSADNHLVGEFTLGMLVKLAPDEWLFARLTDAVLEPGNPVVLPTQDPVAIGSLGVQNVAGTKTAELTTDYPEWTLTGDGGLIAQTRLQGNFGWYRVSFTDEQGEHSAWLQAGPSFANIDIRSGAGAAAREITAQVQAGSPIQLSLSAGQSGVVLGADVGKAFVQLSKSTAPPDVYADNVWQYARKNGAGKMESVVRFPNGSEVIVATES